MDWMLLGALALLLLSTAMALALAVCYRQVQHLRQEMAGMARRLSNQADDIAGLCSAALSVDQRLVQSEKRLGDLFDWMESQKTQEKLNQPYHSAIDLIRRGGDVAQLVSQCGISREEAALLLRLHGGDQ
ncbi:MAG: DUF2802 domain-containing protein [Methylococcaceae bacterium]|nr:MAG: DUF2802 domain-containing protein [Methylococcaceae bacterium]